MPFSCAAVQCLALRLLLLLLRLRLVTPLPPAAAATCRRVSQAGADPATRRLSKTALSHEASRLKELGKALRRCSEEHLSQVHDARLARHICHTFGLPESALDAWERSHEQSRRQAHKRAGASGAHVLLPPPIALVPSPSPTKCRGKRKSPERAAEVALRLARRSRFGPGPAAAEGEMAQQPTPPVRRRRSSEGNDWGIAPRQLFTEGLAGPEDSWRAGETDDMDTDGLPTSLAAGAVGVESSARTSGRGSGSGNSGQDSSYSGGRSTGCPEWRLFKQHMATPSPLKRPLAPPPSLAFAHTPVAPCAPPPPPLLAPACAQPADVEAACSRAEHLAATARRIIAGQASPGTLATVAAAVPAAVQPLSPSWAAQAVLAPAVTPPAKLPALASLPPACQSDSATTCWLLPLPGSWLGPSGGSTKENSGSWGGGGRHPTAAQMLQSPAAAAAAHVAEWGKEYAAADILASFDLGQRSTSSCISGGINSAGSSAELLASPPGPAGARSSSESSSRGVAPTAVPSGSTLQQAGGGSGHPTGCAARPAPEAAACTPERVVVGPWMAAPALPPGTIAVAAGNRICIMGLPAVEQAASVPVGSSTVVAGGSAAVSLAGTTEALRTLDVRGRAHSIAKPLQLSSHISLQGVVHYQVVS